MEKTILEVKDLTVEFNTGRGILKAVDNVSFSIKERETLGIVGESGSGKSVLSLALMGLHPPNVTISASKLSFQNTDLLKMKEKSWTHIRGKEITMIFQESSLNPCYTVEFQILEVLKKHKPQSSRKELDACVIDLLDQVGIPDPNLRKKSYPHELSGGMIQRVMIAIALACEPKLLIADEPTTALDATIQAQILDLLKELQRKKGMSLIFITHDMDVVRETVENLIIMYAGQIIEQGKCSELLENPAHPYTNALIASIPNINYGFREPLPSIPGIVPDLIHRPSGCQFHPRCKWVDTKCKQATPGNTHEKDRIFRCFKPWMEKTNNA